MRVIFLTAAATTTMTACGCCPAFYKLGYDGDDNENDH